MASRPDMRIAHGKSIQIEIKKYGEMFLDSSKQTKNVKKNMVQLQSWVRQSFSPLVLCFFLSDRDDEMSNPDQQQKNGAATNGGVGTTNALTDEEKQVQLRATLNDLLGAHVIPKVRKAIDSCQDQSVLSQTLVKSLADVRKDWNAYLTATKFLLISLESESGKSGTNQVEQIFRRSFQDTVFKEFRQRLVTSLHSLVEQVRADPDKLGSVTTDAQELIKQFFDDLNATSAGAAASGTTTAAPTTAPTTAPQAPGSEWAHSETKKLEDFHNVFIEPYKERMIAQYLELAKNFEMKNDLPGLLNWIPKARATEVNLVRCMFFNVYPADFEALCNNIMYEFDNGVAAHNAQRLVEHNQFGVNHILQQLPLETPTINWEIKPVDDSAVASTATTTDHQNPQVLVNRLKDLYVVASTAQSASTMPAVLRTLPRTITRNSRANERRRDQANEAPVHDVAAFSYFKRAISHHGATAIKTIVDSLRSGQEFPSEKPYSKELCSKLGEMLRQKAAIMKNVCDNDSNIERAYQMAFKEFLNAPENKPTFMRKSRDGTESREHRYPDIVSQYVDQYLVSTESNLDDMADVAVELLSYIVDKDIFVEVYRSSIAKRFLAKDFTDQVRDREDTVLSRLKKHLPANQVRKCGQGMMDDLTASQALKEGFSQSPLATNVDGSVLNPRILGSMNWPQSKALDNTIIWNESLSNAQSNFERWYINKHKTRQLRWQPERGTAVMIVELTKGKKEISMTFIQANVLYHLDRQCASNTDASSKGGLTANELARVTGHKVEDIDCIMMSMVGYMKNQPQIITITGPGAESKKTDHDNDRFAINKDFRSPMKKFGLPAVPSKKGAATDDERPTDKQIEGWRMQLAEAAIIRIMKSSHQLNYEELIRRTIAQLERSFMAQPKFLKKCIESLVSKEYLERDPDDTTIFKYLA